ncbi:MAG: Alpha-1,2-fucosyltransferase [uncultured Sulfurovum sp.]|uniref:Alpha-1,2-fucosyltransferase n=1 Tax=uncultured Sulfurovum sp. TaxID=269237 RepID=A0A6S6TIH2_9BACT|nr:MAG: Alpha-1,2-fucosyltransferase [uncultured Sulfurovum sp.]
MIISKITGGLGNQMFQYAIAKSIATVRNDIFKLDTTAYETYKLHNGYRLNAFSLEVSLAKEDEIFRLRGFDNRIFNKLNFFKPKSYYLEKERTIYDDKVFSYKDIYLDGYWQNEAYFLDIRKSLLEDFKLNKMLSPKAEASLLNIKSSSGISVHVRRGDYLKHPEIGILSVDYYKRAIEYMKGKVENPQFFIFSNDIPWCKENFSFIKEVTYIEESESELEDLELMKSCHHNIVANSSFSWWGAWLNDYKEKIVIAPKQWMAINPKNYKWSPNSWIEISTMEA